MKLSKSIILYPQRKKTFGKDKFYQTKEWKQDRAMHLATHPLCVHCEKLEGRTTMATVSDHIVPINQGGDRWSWNNRQSLCKSHHNKKSQGERDI